MKIKPIVLRIALALAAVAVVLALLPGGSAGAAISQQQAWSLVYSGAAFPGTYSYTVNDGYRRLLVVAVSSTINANTTQTVTVTYGTGGAAQTLTQQIGDGGSNTRSHTYLFYLADTPSVMNGSAQDLAVTISGGTLLYNYVYAAVYAGVDQTTPIGDSQNRFRTATSATIGPFTTALTIRGGEQAVEIINLNVNAPTPARTINTWAANWASAAGPNTALSLYSSYVAARNTAGTTTSQHTASGACYSSMSAMSIRPFTPTVSQDWSLVYMGASSPGTLYYAVDSDPLCLLVVAVSVSNNGNSTRTVTVTYGTGGTAQTLTQEIGDGTTSSRAHTYLFYLAYTSSVMDGSAQELTVTISGGATLYSYIYAAVYTDVDQSDPIGDSKNRNRSGQSSTVGPFTPTGLTIAGGEQAVEIINLTRTSTPARTINTWAANWSSVLGPNSASNIYSSYIAADNYAGTTTSQHTASGTCYSSESAMSIRPSSVIPTPPTETFTPTEPPPTETFTPTEPSPTPTFTPTHTPEPLAGTTYVRYSSMLLNAPDFGLEAQTVSGIAGGGVGPYTVTVYVEDPEGVVANYTPAVIGNYFEISAGEYGAPTNFGCSIQGIWRARFLVQDSRGVTYLTPNITWTVSFPRVHGVP